MSLALLVVTAAQLLDLGTFVRMVGAHGAAAEANPLVASILVDHGMPVVVVVKVAILAFIVASIAILGGGSRDPGHPRLARAVAAVAIVAGVIGGATNVGALLA